MIDLIPPGEESLHEKGSLCVCVPVVDIDPETGELIITHIPLIANIEVG
jgi:hypothetical protein